MAASRRWLFGDQLGPHFLDDPEQPVVLIEAKSVFRRRRFHRQKAHLVLSAMRHRAAELGDRCTFVQADTYSEALDTIGGTLTVCHPTSRAARSLATRRADVRMLPPRGFATGPEEFVAWAHERTHLRMDDFYRGARRRLNVLMDGDQPIGGRWSWDADNRQPPPRTGGIGVAPPVLPVEDGIDERVRADLDQWERDGVAFVGRDGPRLFPATGAEAKARLDDFISHRLAAFGPFEDAMLAGDPFLAHSMLSAPLNLGLLDPMDAVRRAEAALRRGAVPLSSAEGFIRQLIGWRDYVWHLYWYLGDRYARRNGLRATQRMPRWLTELDAAAVEARCLADVLAGVRDRGWIHHIPRLMVLGNYMMQHGVAPHEVLDWFHRCFVDGYEWVMTVNVMGMSQYASDLVTTKPYAAGGAYIHKMSDYYGGCRYHPRIRSGPRACPFTAGYWAFLARNESRLRGNPRLAQPLRQLSRLPDLDAVVDQVRVRGTKAP